MKIAGKRHAGARANINVVSPPRNPPIDGWRRIVRFAIRPLPFACQLTCSTTRHAGWNVRWKGCAISTMHRLWLKAASTHLALPLRARAI